MLWDSATFLTILTVALLLKTSKITITLHNKHPRIPVGRNQSTASQSLHTSLAFTTLFISAHRFWILWAPRNLNLFFFIATL